MPETSQLLVTLYVQMERFCWWPLQQHVVEPDPPGKGAHCCELGGFWRKPNIEFVFFCSLGWWDGMVLAMAEETRLRVNHMLI